MLTNRLARDGDWLFRRRSLLPFVMLVPAAWSLAHLHNYLGDNHGWQHLWGLVCCSLAWLGWLVRVTTVGFVPGGTSGRNTSEQRAADLNTTGWYSLTRNPLYLGNFLIGLGIAAAWLDPLLVLVYVCLFWLYYERIISREEDFLYELFGERYTAWAGQTPVFFPDLRRWTPPDRPFCLRTVLKREYSAVLLIGLAFELIDVVEHVQIEHRLYCDLGWTLHLAACTTYFLLFRTLKKSTRWLHTAGR